MTSPSMYEVGTVGKISDNQPGGPEFNPCCTSGDLLSLHRPWTDTLNRLSVSQRSMEGTVDWSRLPPLLWTAVEHF